MTKPQPFGGRYPQKQEWIPLPAMLEYLDHLATNDYSKAYIRNNRFGIAHFARFCAQEDIKHPEEIERKHFYRFDTYLRGATTWKGTPLGDTTRAISLRNIKTWVRWCLKNGYIQQDPWWGIRLANPRPKPPRPFLDEELTRIFEAHKKTAFLTSPFYYHRREVILALLFGWGLRLGEMPPLTVTAMDIRLKEVRVRKANGAMKAMPYGDELKGIVQRWLRVRGGRARRGEDALLIDQSGYPITETQINHILKDLGARAGVDLTSKRFRDHFGVTMINQNVDLDQVAKMLGLEPHQARRFTTEHDEELKETYDYIIDPLMGRLFGGKAQ